MISNSGLRMLLRECSFHVYLYKLFTASSHAFYLDASNSIDSSIVIARQSLPVHRISDFFLAHGEDTARHHRLQLHQIAICMRYARSKKLITKSYCIPDGSIKYWAHVRRSDDGLSSSQVSSPSVESTHDGPIPGAHCGSQL